MYTKKETRSFEKNILKGHLRGFYIFRLYLTKNLNKKENTNTSIN